MSPERNDLCPCGSGRKYKKCHLAADEAAHVAKQHDNVSPLHALDQALVRKMIAFAARRLPAALESRRTFPGLEGDEAAMQFLAPWTVYGEPAGGRTVLDAFLESHAWSLTPGEREWLDAQHASWYSLHDVREVVRGRGLRLRDLLTVQERFVHEVKGTATIVPHFILLCRVVESRGTAVIAGLYPLPLGPLDGMRVVEKVRALLRHKGIVPPELMRRAGTAAMIARAWDAEVDRLRSQPAPELRNTDGDELLLITERYTFDPSRRAEIESALAAARLVREDNDTFLLLRKKDRTVLGSVAVGDGELQCEANSEARSDQLCEIVEDACGELLTAGLGSMSDPRALMEHDEPSEPIPTAVDFKHQYYLEQWIKDRIPALEDRTPRQAARSKRGRALLDTLLNEIELRESQLPEADRFDVAQLREKLGLPR